MSSNHAANGCYQIANEIISYIKSGVLKSGDTLTGTRQFAIPLNINRNTVVQAFEILLLESWLCASERQGTSVSSKLPTSKTNKKQTESLIRKEEIYRGDLIFFNDGQPNTSCAPVKILARSHRKH